MSASGSKTPSTREPAAPVRRNARKRAVARTVGSPQTVSAIRPWTSVNRPPLATNSCHARPGPGQPATP